MAISIDAEKAFDKIQHPFLTKAQVKLEIKGLDLNIIKAIYNKPIMNNMLSGEKTEMTSSKVWNKTRSLLFFLIFNIVLEFLASAIRQEEKIKGIQMGKEEVKLSLFTYGMILYIKDLKTPPKQS
jgi:hypothetical protein